MAPRLGELFEGLSPDAVPSTKDSIQTLGPILRFGDSNSLDHLPCHLVINAHLSQSSFS